MILRGHVKEGFKGTVQRDFWPPVFFIIEPIWAPDEQAEVFSNSVSISPRYSNLSIEKTDSAQYHTVQSPKICSPKKLCKNINCSMILRRAWLRAVWYCGESILKTRTSLAKSEPKSKLFEPNTVHFLKFGIEHHIWYSGAM